jgi:hypothetical protein
MRQTEYRQGNYETQMTKEETENMSGVKQG